MKIIDTKLGKVVVMSFVNAEHCGLVYDDLEFECGLSGIDLKKDMPIALLVQFDGGFVNPTEKDVVACEKFRRLQRVLCPYKKKRCKR